jgi:large subunit ribosomal protein L15
MPMHRRLPKRGFTPLSKKEFAIVNIGQLDLFAEGAVIDMSLLLESGLISNVLDGVKVLATGDLSKRFTVKAHKFSTAAKNKIIAVGGTVEEI